MAALLRRQMHTLRSFSKISLSPTPSLIGPPEIYAAATNAAAEVSTDNNKESTDSATKTDPFVDCMLANFNTSETLMGYTENHSPTYLSSGDPCLDFFFHVVPDTPPEALTTRLQLAWDHDALKALKLICNLRGVRGTGKADRKGFYAAAVWLHDHHPKTLAGNVPTLVDFGYHKDLLEILFLLLNGGDARRRMREDYLKWKNEMICRRWKSYGMLDRGEELMSHRYHPIPGPTHRGKRFELATKVIEKFNSDLDFQNLHERVSDLFAQRLRSDMEMLKSGNLNNLSLAAKWCPSIGSSYDRVTLLCETIAKKVFPREEYAAEYDSLEEAHYVYKVRMRLRKEVLAPLRKVLQLPEVYMSANEWSSLPYERVASVAMKKYLTKFFDRDGKRFKEFLGRVRSGEAKIAAGALLPHEIISGLNKHEYDADAGEVAELQWKRMVDDISNKGNLKNCLAVCDVSGSMYGTPMDVSVALGILVSELSEEPWKGKLITFSQKPELQKIQGESLQSKTMFVRNMEWGMNTDFQRVFDVILEVAVTGKLKGEEMIKRLFVFSDMEFDRASQNPWETDYQAIVRKFTEKGYGEFVPEIVFWNLRDSNSTPVMANQTGVALVSGFSKNVLSIFIENDGVLNPVEIMDAAISGQLYQQLTVLD